MAPPFALEADSFEAMVLLPSQRCGYGFPEVLASLTSGRVVVSAGGVRRDSRDVATRVAVGWS